jgi:arylsulfatase
VQPNILFILTDQHRFDFLSCAGSDFIRTPNIDRLAESGMHMKQCFTNAPVCAPARLGLATGLQPSRLGALDNHAYLPLTVPTMYQRFRDHGYRVGCVGKLDLAKPDKYNGRHGDRPCVYSYGFTHPVEIEGKMHAGMHDKPHGPYGFYLQERGTYSILHNDYRERSSKGWIAGASKDSALSTDDFADTYIGRRAAEWIESIPNDFPWHLFVSFVGPHDPYDPPTEYANRYRNADMPVPLQDEMENKPEWVRKKRVVISDEEVAHTRRQYCAAIELIDDQIGMIMESLKQRGMSENTIIIFTSDHGDMLGDHGLYQKSVAYEPAIHIPLIVSGPGIRKGQSDALIELIDINPTLCELVGLPEYPRMDARSFAKILTGNADSHRDHVVSRLSQFKCIRTDLYKLIRSISGTDELYDLTTDPNELNNVANLYPEIVNSLSETLELSYREGRWLR